MSIYAIRTLGPAELDDPEACDRWTQDVDRITEELEDAHLVAAVQTMPVGDRLVAVVQAHRLTAIQGPNGPRLEGVSLAEARDAVANANKFRRTN